MQFLTNPKVLVLPREYLALGPLGIATRAEFLRRSQILYEDREGARSLSWAARSTVLAHHDLANPER